MLEKAVLKDEKSEAWWTFEAPLASYVARTPGQVRSALDQIAARVEDDSLFAVGFLAYEAASAFDAALVTRPPGDMPLAVFSLFDAPVITDTLVDAPDSAGASGEWRLATSRERYIDNFASIKQQIELGNCYQVNYTVRQSSRIDAAPWQYFCDVAADAPYAAYLDCDDFAIVSASPELFFALSDSTLTCRPMKGTARRGVTTDIDREVARRLHESAKDRAENIMITDMVRNDLGKIAVPGSVRVESRYDIEKYPTVWQMTSTVTAQSNSPLPDILGALFPCASVTGAPKAASMQIIADLEDSPREVYTGALGYIGPSRRAQFSVAIRTAWIDKKTHVASYGIGSGVVWDSNAVDEFDECLSKAHVLRTTADDRDFSLLETLLWTPESGYFLLEEHIERMQQSANYFDFEFDRIRVCAELAAFAESLDHENQRVRAELSRDGALSLAGVPQPAQGSTGVQRIRMATEPVQSDNPFLYHKTTHRRVYEDALRSVTDCDDVLLWNEHGLITETSIANVVVDLHGERVTPPVSSGLLNGTYRRWLLRKGEIGEREISVDDLKTADGITLINSVRGQFAATLLHRGYSGNRPVEPAAASTARRAIRRDSVFMRR